MVGGGAWGCLVAIVFWLLAFIGVRVVFVAFALGRISWFVGNWVEVACIAPIGHMVQLLACNYLAGIVAAFVAAVFGIASLRIEVGVAIATSEN